MKQSFFLTVGASLTLSEYRDFLHNDEHVESILSRAVQLADKQGKAHIESSHIIDVLLDDGLLRKYAITAYRLGGDPVLGWEILENFVDSRAEIYTHHTPNDSEALRALRVAKEVFDPEQVTLEPIPDEQHIRISHVADGVVFLDDSSDGDRPLIEMEALNF